MSSGQQNYHDELAERAYNNQLDHLRSFSYEDILEELKRMKRDITFLVKDQLLPHYMWNSYTSLRKSAGKLLGYSYD